ncbi:MAG: sugar transferase [Candidatus Dormibacterales bacterium]
MDVAERAEGRPHVTFHSVEAERAVELGEALTPRRSVVSRRIARLAQLTALLDLMTVFAAYVMAKQLRADSWWDGLESVQHASPVILMTIPGWVAVLALYGLYGRRQVTEPTGEMIRLLHATTISVVGTVLVAFVFRVGISRGWIVALWVSAALLLTLERACMRAFIHLLNSRHELGFRTLIVGNNKEARGLARTLARRPHLGYEVVGVVGPDGGTVDGYPVLGKLDQIAEVAREVDAGAVVVAGSSVGPNGFAFIDRALQGMSIRVRVSLGLPYLAASRVVVEPVDGLALLSLEGGRPSRRQTGLKRAFDVVLAGGVLLVLSPVMAVVALLVRVTSGSPVIFSQQRVGAGGKPFTIHKFRTMVVGADSLRSQLDLVNEADGLLFKMRNDPRVTRLGRHLRRLALDELPQLFDVLRGDMSLVGPRPALPAEAELWPEELRGRLGAKPGLTGLWQVSGRHDLTFEDYVRYDLFYVENLSLGLDLRIVARTIPALLLRRGAY